MTYYLKFMIYLTKDHCYILIGNITGLLCIYIDLQLGEMFLHFIMAYQALLRYLGQFL